MRAQKKPPRHQEDLREELYLPEADQNKIIDLYFRKGKTRSYIYGNYRYTKHIVDEVLNHFLDTGTLKTKPVPPRKLHMPPYNDIVRVLAIIQRRGTVHITTYQQLALALKEIMPTWFNDFTTTTIIKHLKVHLGLKKKELKDVVNDSKAEIKADNLRFKRTLVYSKITQGLLTQDVYCLFIDSFSWQSKPSCRYYV